MDELMGQIARNAAHYAVDNWGNDLTDGERAIMWQRYFDSVLAALATFDEIDGARKVRARALVSEN